MQIAKQLQPAAIPHVRGAVCRACLACPARRACVHSALVVIDRGEQPWVDSSRCFGCRACIPACPFGAIALPGQG